MSSSPSEYVGSHCPWCHEDFENPLSCFEHLSVAHFDNDPVDWAMVGTTIAHNRQLTAEGVTDLVGIVFVARYEAEQSDDGEAGVFMGALWMTPNAARQVGTHLLNETRPERLAEIAARVLEQGESTT